MSQEKDNSIDKDSLYHRIIELAEEYNAAKGRPKLVIIMPPEQAVNWGPAHYVFRGEKLLPGMIDGFIPDGVLEHELSFIEQRSSEVQALFSILSNQHQRKTALEIGLGRGGFHMLLRDLFDYVISIEHDSRHIMHLLSHFALDENSIFICGSSQDKATVSQVQAQVQRIDKGVDFLFIDGDHEYEGVKSDYQNYAPLMNPGGIIVFHDAANPSWTGVSKFIGKLTSGHFDGVSRAIISYPECPNLAIETISEITDSLKGLIKSERVKRDSSIKRRFWLSSLKLLLKPLPWRLRESLRAGAIRSIETYRSLGLRGRQVLEEKKE